MDRKTEYIFWCGLFIILLVGLMLSGCKDVNIREDVGMFVSVGLGYQDESNSDELLQRIQQEQCDEWQQAHAGLGIVLPYDFRFGYHHQSWYGCGNPFNDDPEIYTNYWLLEWDHVFFVD